MSIYGKNFYREQKSGSNQSAKAILSVVQQIHPFASAVDVGCGVGPWLAQAIQMGVTDVIGVDGDYVDRSQLMIDPGKFVSHDLETPYRSPRKFDLAISMEVAEHLEERSAPQFVQTLCSLADVVLFSAAIPGQGGVQHLNEQWPDYWEKHFAAQGFCMFDCIRPKVWNMDEIEPWYRQNSFLCVRYPDKFSDLDSRAILRLVHPGHREYYPSIAQFWPILLKSWRRKLNRRLGIV